MVPLSPTFAVAAFISALSYTPSSPSRNYNLGQTKPPANLSRGPVRDLCIVEAYAGAGERYPQQVRALLVVHYRRADRRANSLLSPRSTGSRLAPSRFAGFSIPVRSSTVGITSINSVGD